MAFYYAYKGGVILKINESVEEKLKLVDKLEGVLSPKKLKEIRSEIIKRTW